MILEFPKYTQKPIFSRNFNFIDKLSFKTRIPFANRNFRAPPTINCAPHLFGFFFSLAFSIQRKEKSMKEKNSNWNFNVAKFSCNPVAKIYFFQKWRNNRHSAGIHKLFKSANFYHTFGTIPWNVNVSSNQNHFWFFSKCCVSVERIIV